MVGVTDAANPLDDPADAVALARHAEVLLSAVDVVIAPWVVRSVELRWTEWSGSSLPAPVAARATEAAAAASADVVAALRDLLAADVDEQRMNPLAIIRRAVGYATAVLAAEGVPPVRRDADSARIFPDDVYDLSPASFREVAPALHEPGMTWGAAKAHVILVRRRR